MKKEIPIGKRCFTVYDSIFKQGVVCLINYKAKDYEDWLNRNKIKDIDYKSFDNFHGFSTEYIDKGGRIKRLIVIPDFNWTLKNQGTLIHEITHIIIIIFSYNNIPFNSDTQEFIAHSIGNMYEDIGAKLFRLKS